MMLGVFNKEKQGGPSRVESTFVDFRSFVSEAGLFDLQHSGDVLSWRGTRHNRNVDAVWKESWRKRSGLCCFHLVHLAICGLRLRTINQCLPVDENLIERRLDIDLRCHWCGEMESIEHPLYHCRFAKEVWSKAPTAKMINFADKIKFPQMWKTMRPRCTSHQQEFRLMLYRLGSYSLCGKLGTIFAKIDKGKTRSITPQAATVQPRR